MTKMVTAAQIAKEMKLTPKRVRSILRKLEMKHDGRWKFPAAEKAKIKEAVRNSRKRATVNRKPTKAPVKRTPSRRRHEEQHVVLH